MTSDLLAFYDSIEASPDDHLIRGVFADALDEAGDHTLALGYRWMAQYGKRAHSFRFQANDYSWFNEENPVWYAGEWGGPVEVTIMDPASDIPFAVYEPLLHRVHQLEGFSTRRAAEDAVARLVSFWIRANPGKPLVPLTLEEQRRRRRKYQGATSPSTGS